MAANNLPPLEWKPAYSVKWALQVVMSRGITLAVLSGALVALSALFSWVSYRFAEAGATPDGDEFEGLHLDLVGMMRERGARQRARMSAKLLFNTGVLSISASIPLGLAIAYSGAGAGILICITVLIVLWAIINAARSLHRLWEHRREDAFDSFYAGNKLGWIYRNTDAVRGLYFSMNPMPFWTIFRREWGPDLDEPTAEQLLETNDPPR